MPQYMFATGEIPAEKCAFVSRALTESLVLGRDVRVVLQGIDRNDCLFAEVKYSTGGADAADLGQHLVQQGMAKVCCGVVHDVLVCAVGVNHTPGKLSKEKQESRQRKRTKTSTQQCTLPNTIISTHHG